MSDVVRRIAERYELVAPLGEGGMGVVWRARDTRLGRTVAVKLLSAAAVGSETARARLVREARAAATLEHEGIVRVYDVGELADGGAFLVMELVRGRSLRDVVTAAPLPPGRAARVIAAAARALEFAHRSGVVHRDVKPDNIMLREDDRVVVVDFGVAKPVATEIVANAETVAGITSTSLTGAGQIVGTPAYLSPEQARGGAVDACTDQFALAVTAFETMTGERPWSGKTVVEVVAAILKDEPRSLRALVPDAPETLEAVLLRALAKEPKDRYRDMTAFAEALEAAAAGLASGAPVDVRRSSAPPSSSIEAPGAAGAHPGTVSTHGGHTRSARKEPRLPFGKLLAIVGGVGIAAALFTAFRGGGPSRDASDAAAAATSSAASGAVACPPFEVVGVEGAYLGAAAAALACERVQLARGGRDASTRSPAELVGAPREIVPSFPSSLLDAPTSRETALLAAKRGPWLDGKLEKQVALYVATIVVRAGDGRELARGEGRAVEIFEAVRDALAPTLHVLAPPAEVDRAHLNEWLDVDTADSTGVLLDVRTAILIEDPTSIREACGALEQTRGLSPRVVYLARSMCRRKLRIGPLAEPPPPLDDATPAALITTALAAGSAGGPAGVRERASRLEQLREKTSIPEGRARLSAAAAELYNMIGDERGRDAARNATLHSPKAVDWRTSAWHRIAFSQAADASLAAAMQTWQPWEPITQSVLGGRRDLRAPDAGTELSFEGRGYLLSRRGPYASAYGTNLLELGDVEAARNVAELAQDELLRIEIMLAEARYAAVLEKIPGLLAAMPATDETAAQAFRFAYQGGRASLILDRPATFVGTVVDRWVLSEPHHVIDGVAPFLALVNACVLAPRKTGRACIERLEQLRREGKLATIFSTIETVLAGASRFVAEDYAGAVRSWRTLLRSAGWVQGPLREPLAIAFDRAGEMDLADEVDAPVLRLVDYPRTADLAWVRAAKRAHKRGDVVLARKLASAVVDKWRFADDKIPATAEMRELLAKLPPAPRP